VTGWNDLASLIPRAPDWQLDYPLLRQRFDWIAALEGCEQDASFHAEGDVAIHTEMVCTELVASVRFRALPRAAQEIVFVAALMHDVAKPACTRVEDGRITSRGHSTRGEIMARRILWELGVALETREQIAGLIRYHQIPFFLLEADDPRRRAFRVSQAARCDLLAIVAWADAAGRRCADPGDRQRLMDNCELFDEYCAEQGCQRGAKEFASPHSRFLYFRKPARDPSYYAHDNTRSRAIVLSGLPAAGKDYWIAENAADVPCVSLDAIRRELGIAPDKPPGRVIKAARERARAHLRAGAPLVWNATNLSRDIRGRVIDLCADYNAWVEVVQVETTVAELHRRNEARDEPVPRAALSRMLDRWTIADLSEAHQIALITS